MIVRHEHLEFDYKRRDELVQELSDVTSEEGAKRIAEEEAKPFFTSTPEYCFVCGEHLNLPAVMWHGFSGVSKRSPEVWMHPTCAKDLSHRLLRDANELRLGKAKADQIFDRWGKGQSGQ